MKKTTKTMHYDEVALEIIEWHKERIDRKINEMSNEELEDEYKLCFNEQIKIQN